MILKIVLYIIMLRMSAFISEISFFGFILANRFPVPYLNVSAY